MHTVNTQNLEEVRQIMNINKKYIIYIFITFTIGCSFAGIFALQGFKKGDVICDYHGKEVRDMPIREYVNQPGVDSNFCIEVQMGANKRIIDASSEVCTVHPYLRCLGRLANHATIGQPECNAKLVEIYYKQDQVHTAPISSAILIANRNIEPLEEIRWDYLDENARAMFS